MAKKELSLEGLSDGAKRILTKRCQRLNLDISQVCWDRAPKDVVREEVAQAIHRLIEDNNIPEAVVLAVEAGE